jgi:NADH-quinone oxidoreductase subunit C
MRSYRDPKNAQARECRADRFRAAPELARLAPQSDEVFGEDVASLRAKFDIQDAYIEAGQLVVWIDKADNVKVLKHLKTKLFYNNLSEMSAVDFLAERGEFEVFYQMLSMKKRRRLRVKCLIKPDEVLQSCAGVYKSADWAEREAYDMFGISLGSHPYPKRILMPDDWVGHPLLKSYPLHGDEAAQWYEIDALYGREYRDLVGPEIRDAARVDRTDTHGWARLGREVHFGEEYSEEPTKLAEFQEEGGVMFVKRFKKDKAVTLKKRH